MSVTIKKVEQGDFEILLKLMIGYFEFYQVQNPPTDKLKSLISELSEKTNPSIQFIAKINDEGVGFVTLYEIYSTLSASKVMLMNDLYVKPKFRGNGIGKKLFNIARSYTIENGYPKMEWMTEPTNIRAKKFYDDLGGKSSEWIYYSIK